MVSVYIIKSLNYNWYYVGISKDIQQRLKAHNLGKQRSTKFYKPFKLVYSKNFKDYTNAREYEKYLKVASNKEKIIRN